VLNCMFAIIKPAGSGVTHSGSWVDTNQMGQWVNFYDPLPALTHSSIWVCRLLSVKVLNSTARGCIFDTVVVKTL